MINKDTVMIGHSIGAVFSVKYVLDTNIKIDKLVLVSGFNNFFSQDKEDIHNTINASYYVHEKDIGKINRLVNEIICIYGDIVLGEITL